uniref:SH3 domain-binding protein 5 homolog n=1 Tax=Timema cristinae TaxID=61476 RepID=A0A7R9CZ09_TIMCR|nr:unnamed protein product [Timema cristinae]
MEQICSPDETEDSDLDPRIQLANTLVVLSSTAEDGEIDFRISIELEKLNNATDEINKLEIELDEANTTFRLLLNDSTRRLKLQSKKLGSCIERARPYYEALEVAKQAQLECQRAAVQFQRANEIHQAAKETVALAEQRFVSKQHVWQFDNAWQEMLNHATLKVRDAEDQKSESGREHQKKAMLFNAAEQKVQQLEQRLRRNIAKSRPYFDEKVVCQGQLAAQKDRVEALQRSVAIAKSSYSNSLKELERISEEIHLKRRILKESLSDAEDSELLKGPREPGVGAELNTFDVSEFSVKVEPSSGDSSAWLPQLLVRELADCGMGDSSVERIINQDVNRLALLSSYEQELDRCDLRSMGSQSAGNSSAVSERDESETTEEAEDDLEELKLRVRELAVRPVEGCSTSDVHWERELNATVNRLDHMMLMQECSNDLSEMKLVTDDTN